MRLIDADKLADELEALCEKVPRQRLTLRIIANGLRHDATFAPAIDPESLRSKGEWEEADDGDGVVCSACREDFCTIINETDRYNFCPNCGADMRKEVALDIMIQPQEVAHDR